MKLWYNTNMKTATVLLCAAFAALSASAKTSTPEGWLDDFDAALKKAAAEKKHVLVDFSGSDWCGWCKRLDREVFDTDVFRKGAADKYVLLMVDTPRDKSLLSPNAAKNNPGLVKKFNVRGFPTVVVLDPKGKEVFRTGYKNGGPEKYLNMLDDEVRLGPELKKYIKPIEAVLTRHDAAMQKEAQEAMAKIAKKFPEVGKNAAKAMKGASGREVEAYAKKVMFEEVFPKYVPLCEKVFAEAKAMKVPQSLEERKKALIDEHEQRFNMLKKSIKEYQDSKKTSKK